MLKLLFDAQYQFQRNCLFGIYQEKVLYCEDACHGQDRSFCQIQGLGRKSITCMPGHFGAGKVVETVATG